MDMRNRAYDINQRAEASRGRLRAPSWTLPMYKWWAQKTGNEHRRDHENLCHFFWTPVRAAGVWLKEKWKATPLDGYEAAIMIALTLSLLGAAVAPIPWQGALIGLACAYVLVGLIVGSFAVKEGKKFSRLGSYERDVQFDMVMFAPLVLTVKGLSWIAHTSVARWIKDHGLEIYITWCGLLIAIGIGVGIHAIIVNAGLTVLLFVLAGIAVGVAILWLARRRWVAGAPERKRRAEAEEFVRYKQQLIAIYGEEMFKKAHRESGTTIAYERWFDQRASELHQDDTPSWRLMHRPYSVAVRFTSYDSMMAISLEADLEKALEAWEQNQSGKVAARPRQRIAHVKDGATDLAALIWAYLKAKKMGICPLIDVGEIPTTPDA